MVGFTCMLGRYCTLRDIDPRYPLAWLWYRTVSPPTKKEGGSDHRGTLIGSRDKWLGSPGIGKDSLISGREKTFGHYGYVTDRTRDPSSSKPIGRQAWLPPYYDIPTFEPWGVSHEPERQSRAGTHDPNGGHIYLYEEKSSGKMSGVLVGTSKSISILWQ